jgi:hypothetical protein
MYNLLSLVISLSLYVDLNVSIRSKTNLYLELVIFLIANTPSYIVKTPSVSY